MNGAHIPSTVTDAKTGMRWQDHRATLANIWRRWDRDETVQVCVGCGCEMDVAAVAHSPRCPE